MVADVFGPEEIAQRLSELDSWDADDGSITRSVEMSSFPEAIELVNKVAEVAEEMDHHPDIDIRWRSVKFGNATHSAGGVTELDFTLAARIDAIIRGFTGGK